MSLELASVRAMSPFFGASVFVWTNLIGVILAALSLGYFVGGRIADRSESVRPVGWTLLVAGLWSFWIPSFLSWLGGLLLPSELRMEDAFLVLWGGSLLSGFLVFAPPAFLISFTSPYAVRLLGEAGRLGSTAGAVFALSTAGSILGTFLTTYLLIPVVGSRTTFWGLGSVLGLSGALLLIASRCSGGPREASALLLVLAHPFFALALAGRPLKTPLRGEILLAEAETPYQFVQLVRSGDLTILRVNEGLDSYQSLWKEGSLLTGAYYDAFLLAPLLAEKLPGERLRVLIVGLGGGTASRQIEGLFGGRHRLEIDGIEIDPGLVRAAAPFFKMNTEEQPHLRILSDLDGRAFLRCVGEPYDVVLLDAYAGQIQIPFHLCSREFFREAWERLADRGVLAINVGAIGRTDPVLLAVANTVSREFGEALGFPVRDARNEVLFCRKGRPLPALEEIHSKDPLPQLRALLGYAAFPGIARRYRFHEELDCLDDDSSSVEILQALSLIGGLRP